MKNDARLARYSRIFTDLCELSDELETYWSGPLGFGHDSKGVVCGFLGFCGRKVWMRTWIFAKCSRYSLGEVLPISSHFEK